LSPPPPPTHPSSIPYPLRMNTRSRTSSLKGAQSSASLPTRQISTEEDEKRLRRESTGMMGSRPVDRRLDLLRAREAFSEPSTTVEKSDSEDDERESSSDDINPVPFRSGLQSRQSDPNPPSRPSRSPLSQRTTSAFSLPVSSSNELEDRDVLTYQKVIARLQSNEDIHREVAIGRRIGFYRLGKELGSGNFSKVKIGSHILTNERVAVKIMEKAKMDAKSQKLLSREIENMEKAKHPNIIQLFEVVETISRVHLVCEYARGGELYMYVHEKGKLQEKEGKLLFAQLIAAVEHLHSLNIAHRDIKAENIMFSEPGGSLRLVDFGFSRFIGDETVRTFCGSPPYAAPELFQSDSYDGKAVDMWACGVLLYFILVGVTPFRGETVQDLKGKVLEGKYTFPEYLSLFSQEVMRRLLEMKSKERMKVAEVKRMYWMRDSRFPTGIELEEPKGTRERLLIYGINEQMIEESSSKGARCAVSGTYRSVCFQIRREQREMEERMKKLKLQEEATRIGVEKRIAKSDSKICSIQ
ncbi:hypothetical protein PENTCL1PPCAC_6651, partial [Pristionchus entomophagus]